MYFLSKVLKRRGISKFVNHSVFWAIVLLFFTGTRKPFLPGITVSRHPQLAQICREAIPAGECAPAVYYL